MHCMNDFKDFTGWTVVYKISTRYPEYKEELRIETAKTRIKAYNKALNAIREYYAHDIIIYYVIDGIAEIVINDFNLNKR